MIITEKEFCLRICFHSWFYISFDRTRGLQSLFSWKTSIVYEQKQKALHVFVWSFRNLRALKFRFNNKIYSYLEKIMDKYFND